MSDRYLTGVVVVAPDFLQVGEGSPSGIANQVHIDGRVAKLYDF